MNESVFLLYVTINIVNNSCILVVKFVITELVDMV